MMKSPMMKMVWKAAWLISALASINVGLAALGYDFFSSDFVIMRMASLVHPLFYVIGVAGLVSLISFCMCCTKKECDCSCDDPKACPRCGSMTGCNCR